MILSKSIESTVRKGHIYGNPGDEVKVISDDGQVAIVEDRKGERFPVNSALLAQDFESEEKVEEEQKIILNQVPRRLKKTKVVPKKQNTLFL